MPQFSLKWFILLCSSLVLLGWSWPSSSPESTDDLDLLLSTMNPYTSTVPSIYIKYSQSLDLPMDNPDQLKAAAVKLSQQLGWKVSEVTFETVQGQPVITITESETSINKQLKLSQLHHGNPYLSIQLHTNDGNSDSIKALKQMRDTLEHQMSKQKLAIERHTILQADSNLNRAQLPEFWSHLRDQLDAEVVEAYETDSTYSYSYMSDTIDQTIMSGFSTMNVQAAMHEDTETGVWRLTLGTPIITMEY